MRTIASMPGRRGWTGFWIAALALVLASCMGGRRGPRPGGGDTDTSRERGPGPAGEETSSSSTCLAADLTQPGCESCLMEVLGEAIEACGLSECTLSMGGGDCSACMLGGERDICDCASSPECEADCTPDVIADQYECVVSFCDACIVR